MDDTMFQFQPALQPKKISRASTPRALVVPETAARAVGTAAPTASVSASASASAARKYQVQQDEGLTTGLPSARSSSTAPNELQPRGAATHRPTSNRRTLRGSLHHLRRESLVLTRALVRSSRHLYQQLSLRQLLAYLLVLFGLLSESFTPAPRHNVPMGIALFMASTGAESLDHRVAVAGLCAATLIDFAWLLRPQEAGALNGFLHVQWENATHLCLAVCAAIKLWLLFATYFDLGPEVDDTATMAPPSPLPVNKEAATGSQHRLWSRLRFLFPRKTLPRRSHLSYEVLMRVLGLVWIHGVCGLVLLVLGLVTVMGLSGKAVFRSAALGLPLPLAMLFKSASTLLSYVLATHHMSYHGCLAVSGCDTLAKYYEASASDVVLRYNAKWVRRVRHAKVLDALLGVYLLVVYYSAIHSTTFIAGDLVLAVLVLTAIILVVLDVWVPLLILVVARCATVLHIHHCNGTVDVDPYYPNQLEWEEEDDEGVKSTKQDHDGKSDSSSSSSSELDDESSGGSDSSSRSGNSTDTKQRRSQAMRRLASNSSSRSPLIPPLKRANSMLIVDAVDLGEREDVVGSSKPYWVRYWDDESGRSYLVHGITNETVWEMGGPVAPLMSPTARESIARSRISRGGGAPASPRNLVSTPDSSASTPALRALPSFSSFAPMASGRANSRRGSRSARVSSHPTSESDVIVTSATGAFQVALSHTDAAHHQDSGSLSSRRASLALLSYDDFMLLWDGLPDGGNFTCRVSRVPTVEELRHHLSAHGFSIASDALNNAGLRMVHFYAISGAGIGAPIEGEENARCLSGVRSASVAFFLGEFVFNSLSLKLFARFRSPEIDAIVPFVKKLQLKEIVGAYSPCE